MDQAFILPLPESKRAPGTEDFGIEQKKTAEFKWFSLALERLRSHKMSWDEFFQIVDPLDPILRNITTKEGDNILHLAVIFDLDHLPNDLGEDPSLLLKRNLYGLTPIELSQFLKRGRFSKQLHPLDPIPFTKTKGVLFEDLKQQTILDNLFFLPNPVFESEETFYTILSRSQKAKTKDKVPPEKTWMGIYFDKEIQQATHPSVSIRFIDDEIGFGVFAEQRIPSCSFIGEYTGIIQEKKPKEVKDKRYCVRYTTWQMGKRNYIIDAEQSGNFTRFINHSAQPNLSLQSVYWRGMPRMIFIALKEIEEGTQFTFDYGTFYWKECQQTPKQF